MRPWTNSPAPAVPAGTDNFLTGVSADSSKDAWAVGYYNPPPNNNGPNTLTLHWNGMAWSVVPSPNAHGQNNSTLNGISAISSTDAWAVGSYLSASYGSETLGLIEHWNGTQWNATPSPPVSEEQGSILYGVTAIASNNGWAVGTIATTAQWWQTYVIQWDGTQWSIVSSSNATTQDNHYLNAITAVSANDIWAVGNYHDNGQAQTLIEHWNGTAWSIVPSPSINDGIGNFLYAATAISTNDVWVVGSNGNPMAFHVYSLADHWNGTTWSIVNTPSPGAVSTYMYGVAAISSGNVVAVGYYSGPNSGGAVDRAVERETMEHVHPARPSG